MCEIHLNNHVMKCAKINPSDPISHKLLLKLYNLIVRPRQIEEKMLLLLRQGKVSKWFSGIGQEAIAVGCTAALEPDEYVLPLHRNLGVFTTREMPLARLMAQWQGTASGYSNGRERSFHFGTNEHHIVGMISHLGPQLCIADGIALACKLRKERKATLVFSGEGGTSEGDFHEALNVAAVWDLPVIFVIENNGYGLSTPSSEQFRCKELRDRAIGYGIEGRRIDGNDLLEVYNNISEIAASIRDNPRPVLVECMTFRMRGHEEASGVKYVPKELIEQWAKKDPVLLYEKKLASLGLLDEKKIAEIKKDIKTEIDRSVDEAFSENPLSPNTERELADVYAPSKDLATPPSSNSLKTIRFIDAISAGLKLSLRKHPNLILMGQDIAEYGGVFKITEGFLAEFGKDRIRNTPLCESAIIGAALGLSIKGFKSVVEMQFADFVSCGFNQIVNNLAKIHYRWGQNADVVIRMPCGAGTGAGPFHSQSNEAWFTHTPGLKVVFPATPFDAKGLLTAAIEDPNPVMFFEHKALYRGVSAEVPEEYYSIPIGQANVAREGEQFTIITYGMGLHWALKLLEKDTELDPYILDLRTLLPLDYPAIDKAVKASGRVLILHEDTIFGGFGGEIAAYISQYLFKELDAPIIRCASLDTPVPFAAPLEKNFLANARLEAAIQELIQA